MYRIFILSPAKTTGQRAHMVLSPRASFDLAHRLRNGGAPIGEVFAFLSGLYFRGKLAYATRFAQPSLQVAGVWVITSNRGLLPVETIVTPEDLLAFREVDIDPADARYVHSLQTSAITLADKLPRNADVVLLGSISSKKYVESLLTIFDNRLQFPSDFIGRGDMSRGGLLLRCVAAQQELNYIPLAGAIRHGKRPPKLGPKPR